MLQAEEIKLNWEHYRRRVNELFPTRADKLNKMYDDYKQQHDDLYETLYLDIIKTDKYKAMNDAELVDISIKLSNFDKILYNQ